MTPLGAGWPARHDHSTPGLAPLRRQDEAGSVRVAATESEDDRSDDDAPSRRSALPTRAGFRPATGAVENVLSDLRPDGYDSVAITLSTVNGLLVVCATVLAAIGIGVGAESGSGPTLYGPAGAQFTVAFPAQPEVKTCYSGRESMYETRKGSEVVEVVAWSPARCTSTKTLPSTGGGPCRGSVFIGWVAYAPLSSAALVSGRTCAGKSKFV